MFALAGQIEAAQPWLPRLLAGPVTATSDRRLARSWAAGQRTRTGRTRLTRGRPISSTGDAARSLGLGARQPRSDPRPVSGASPASNVIPAARSRSMSGMPKPGRRGQHTGPVGQGRIPETQPAGPTRPASATSPRSPGRPGRRRSPRSARRRCPIRGSPCGSARPRAPRRSVPRPAWAGPCPCPTVPAPKLMAAPSAPSPAVMPVALARADRPSPNHIASW